MTKDVRFKMAATKRTYSARREYIIKAVRKRRKKIREMAVAYKGGKCERCSYDRVVEVLEFHHRDPSQKDFGISEKGYTRSWERVRREIDKCALLCANCHRELHVQLAALAGNSQVIKRVNSGNSPPKLVGGDNPEPSLGFIGEEGAETRHSPPKAAKMAAMVKG